MSGKAPATKIEDRLRENELLNKQGELNENLLRQMQKQAQELANQNKKLEGINLAKQVQSLAEKETNRLLQQTDILQNNILKRTQAIAELNDKNKNIVGRITDSRIKSAKFSDTELKTLIAFKDMYGKYLLSRKIGGGLTTEELKTLKEFKAIRKSIVGSVKTGSTLEKQITKELVLQTGAIQTQNERSRQKLEMRKESVALWNAEKKHSASVVNNMMRGLSGTHAWNQTLVTSQHLLQSMGIKTQFLGNLMKTGPLVAAAGFLTILSEIFNMFKELDKAAWDARKEMGMMRNEHVILRKQAEDLFKEYAHLGVETQMVYKTQKAISLELGSSFAATKEIVEQATLMAAQFGVSEETSVKLLKNMGQMFGTTARSQTQMVGFAGALANAAGVPLPQVMDDIARSSEVTRTMFANTPLDMIKTAVEARRLGTTLDKMSASSRKILNFTESMEAEMEASVLLGRPINLQLARQLAYSGKIAESNREILKIAKMTDFEHMDPFQAEAFARATEKSVDELRSMIQSEREQVNIRRHAESLSRAGDNSMKKRLEAHEKLMNSTKKTAEEQGKIFELTVKQQANQDRLTSISNSWKKVIADIGLSVLPIIDKGLKVIADTTPIIAAGFKPIVQMLYWITAHASMRNLVADAVRFIRSFGAMKGIAKVLTTMFKSLGKFTLVLNVVFAVWNVIKAIYTGVSRIVDVWKSGDGVLKKIGKTFLEIGRMALGVVGGIAEGLFGFIIDIPILILKGFGWAFGGVVKQFADMVEGWWDVVKDWLGFSPSKVGLLIVNGITSVGGMLLDAVISPFKLAWDFIKNTASKIGPVLLNAAGSVSSMMFGNIIGPFKKGWEWISGMFSGGKTNLQPSVSTSIVGSKKATLDVSVDKPMTDREIKSYKELDKVPTGETVKETAKSTEQGVTSMADMQAAILAELKGFRQDLVDGKIAVNLDGQLVSTTMNRNNSFRGTYGATQR